MRKTAALALAAAMSVLWCGNAFAQSVLAQLPTVSCTEDITYTQAEMLKIVNDSARLQRHTAENAQAFFRGVTTVLQAVPWAKYA